MEKLIAARSEVSDYSLNGGRRDDEHDGYDDDAGRQQDDVARNHGFDRQRLDVPIAQHAGAGLHVGSEGGDRRLRAVLPLIADADDRKDDREHDGGIDPVPERVPGLFTRLGLGTPPAPAGRRGSSTVFSANRSARSTFGDSGGFGCAGLTTGGAGEVAEEGGVGGLLKGGGAAAVDQGLRGVPQLEASGELVEGEDGGGLEAGAVGEVGREVGGGEGELDVAERAAAADAHGRGGVALAAEVADDRGGVAVGVAVDAEAAGGVDLGDDEVGLGIGVERGANVGADELEHVGLLGVGEQVLDGGGVEVEVDIDIEEDGLHCDLNTGEEEGGLLIGRHGGTLDALRATAAATIGTLRITTSIDVPLLLPVLRTVRPRCADFSASFGVVDSNTVPSGPR